MKLEEIRKFPKLKYATNVVTCLDLDLVIALHDNMVQIDVFSFSTGKAIFKHRMKRHNTIVDIRVDRIKKGSSAKSVGEFRLWKFSKCMK